MYLIQTVNITCYCDKGITASTKPVSPFIVGISRDLEKDFKLGEPVTLYYNGKSYLRFIGDRTHRRIKNTVDIWCEDCNWCRKFGRQQGIILKRIN